MASEVKTNKVSPSTGVTVTLGDASDVFQLPASAEIDIASGATLDVNGTIDVTGATTTGFPAGGMAGVQVYTSGSTWTKATRATALGVTITKVIVEVQAGGAGGGKSLTGNICMGGSGGGYAKKLLDVTGVTSSTISVGAAGVGATSADAAGTDGGDSSWVDSVNTDVIGIKGVGGNTSQTYTVGGLATGGDINIQGGTGRKGFSSGGAGGSSQMGRGGPSADGSGNPATNPDASGYGSGGGGVQDAARAGNATQGIVIVWEYQ